MNPEAIEAAAKALANDTDPLAEWDEQAAMYRLYYVGRVKPILEAAAPYLIREAQTVDGREELAKVLGDHYSTSAGGDDYLWAMADILIGRGFGKVREARAAELEAAADHEASRSQTFMNIMEHMVESREHDRDDILPYGAYSAQAQTSAYWLRARAAAIRAGGA